METCFLDGKKAKISQNVIDQFLAHSLQIAKNSGKNRFFLQIP